MKIAAAADDLVGGYEALRAQAVGELSDLTPRGLGVFMRGGLPGWMVACAPSTEHRSRRSPVDSRAPARRLSGASTELVRMLAEMALVSSRRRCWA